MASYAGREIAHVTCHAVDGVQYLAGMVNQFMAGRRQLQSARHPQK
jgi:hypothetical protein